MIKKKGGGCVFSYSNLPALLSLQVPLLFLGWNIYVNNTTEIDIQ